MFTVRLRLQNEFDSVAFFLAKVESKIIIFLNFTNIEIFKGITYSTFYQVIRVEKETIGYKKNFLYFIQEVVTFNFSKKNNWSIKLR